MNKTQRYDLRPCFAHAALYGLIALGAGATGCSEDDGSTEAEAGSASSAGGPTATAPCEPTPTPAPTAPVLPPGTFGVCERPESAYFDGGSSSWYVSCMAKSDVPGDGYVTRLNADATESVTARFVTDLDEPKGIRVNDGKLYVSNVDELVTADLATGERIATTSIVGIDARVPEQSSLNDVTVDPATGDVYVSDNRNDILYRFDANGASPELLVAGPVLEGPNGLLIDDRGTAGPRLLIASLGPGLNPMLGVTEKLGSVLAIDLADLNDGDDAVEATRISQRIGNLDGIERYGDDLIVSDFFAGRVLRLTPTLTTPTGDEGDGQIIRQSLANSADLGIDVDTGVIMVPETGRGTLLSIELAP